MADNELVFRQEVAKEIRLAPRTIMRLVKVGAFPKPIKVGLRKLAWRRSDLDEWKETGTV